MMKRLATTAVFLWLAACTTAAPRLNEYGLHVVDTHEEYVRTVRADASKQLVDLRSLPGITLDIRYATEENFMEQRLYPSPEAWLRAPAAVALARVQKDLAAEGLGLKVFDAYRPYSVTRMMWEPIRNPDYVADPAKGSRHNRGAAVDVTLVLLATGEELAMPTGYDDFTERAGHGFRDLPQEVLANRERLRRAMERRGFSALESEWWHYDFTGWERFELLDLAFDELR
jgi:zinc D-Ala-D-Ala dipeptidase